MQRVSGLENTVKQLKLELADKVSRAWQFFYFA